MDLHTVEQVIPASLKEQDARDWQEGDAWLGGGTWLFSAEQPHLRRLRDLMVMPSDPPILEDDRGLTVRSTCTIAELDRYPISHTAWPAACLIGQCCHSFLAGFKILNAATVGGNICMSLPAGPMISLCVALDGVYTLRSWDGVVRTVAALDFTTGDHQNILAPGELLQSIHLPALGLQRTVAMRRFSLVKDGRSSVLVIGSHDPGTGSFALTITAATSRPVQLRFPVVPQKEELRHALADQIEESLWFDDPNGTPEHRRHLTAVFAEDLRTRLA
ncbi:MAG: FAD binding domain-containing protein [Synechococcus sp.]|nr:FAD binding domain-containing protein [Synechococcus sp.]